MIKRRPIKKLARPKKKQEKISPALLQKRIRYQKQKAEEDAFFWPDRKFLEPDFVTEKFLSLISYHLAPNETVPKSSIAWNPTTFDGSSQDLSYFTCLTQLRLHLLNRQKELIQRANIRQSTWPAEALILPDETESNATSTTLSTPSQSQVSKISDFVIMSVQTLAQLIKESIAISPELCNGAIEVLAQTFGSMLPQTLLDTVHPVIGQVEQMFSEFLEPSYNLPSIIDRGACLNVILNLAIARGNVDSLYRAVDVLLRSNEVAPIEKLSVNPGFHLLTSCRLPSSYDPIGVTGNFSLPQDIPLDSPFTIATDGVYLYAHSSKSGILKIGTGYQNTNRGELVSSLPQFGHPASRSWLGVGIPNLLFYRDDAMGAGELMVLDSSDLTKAPVLLSESLPLNTQTTDESALVEFISLGRIGEQPGLLFVHPDPSLKTTLLGYAQIKDGSFLIRFFEADLTRNLLVPLLDRGIISISSHTRAEIRTAVLGTTPYDSKVPAHLLPCLGLPEEVDYNVLTNYSAVEDIVSVRGTPDMMMLITSTGASYFTGDCAQYSTLKASKAAAPKKLYSSLALKAAYGSPEAQHFLLLSKSGQLYSVGNGNHGVLGHGNKENLTSPKAILAFKDMTIVSAAAASQTSLAVTSTGKVYAWGQVSITGMKRNQPRPVDITASFGALGDEVPVAVFNSLKAFFLLTNRGTLYAWGIRGTGHGAKPSSLTPATAAVSSSSANSEDNSSVAIEGEAESLAVPVPPSPAVAASSSSLSNKIAVNDPSRLAALSAVKVLDVACGKEHVLALVENPDGTTAVYAWGESKTGALGLGDLTTAPIPTCIEMLTELKPLKIAAGADHSLVLASNGSVYGFGSNAQNQLGLAEPQSTIPVLLSTILRATAIFAFENRSLVTGSPLPATINELLTLPQLSVFSDGYTIGIVLPHDGFKFVEPESGDATPSVAIAASSAQSLSPARPFEYFVRIFNLRNKEHLGDLPGLTFSNASTPPAIALDIENRSYWRLNLTGSLGFDLIQHNVPSKPELSPYSPTAILRNPKVSVSSGFIATASPLQTSTALLAAIDAASMTIESSASTNSATGALPSNLEPSSVNRFSAVAGVNWGYSGSPDAISFSVSEPIYVVGFGLYTGNSSSTAVISIRETSSPEGTAVETPTSGSISPSGTSPCSIFFDSWILLSPGITYTAVAVITGDQTHSGNDGQSSLVVDGVTFTFMGADGNTNGTSISSGQIPVILFHTVAAVEESKRRNARNQGAAAFVPKPSLHTGISEAGITSLTSTLRWAMDRIYAIVSRQSEDQDALIFPISIAFSCFRTIQRNIKLESLKPHLHQVSELLHNLFRSPLFELARSQPDAAPASLIIKEACLTYECSFLTLFPDAASQSFVLLVIARFVRAHGSSPLHIPGAGALLQAVAHLLSTTASFSPTFGDHGPSEFPPQFPAYSRGFFSSLINEIDSGAKSSPPNGGNLLARFSRNLSKDKSKGKGKGKEKVEEHNFERLFSGTLLHLSLASSEYPSVVDILLRSQTKLLRDLSAQANTPTKAPATVHKVTRFPSSSGEWGYGSTPDSISFMVSQPVTIVGMCLYGGGGSYTATLGIHLGDTEAESPLITSEVSYEEYDSVAHTVMFEETLLLEPDTLYTASALITGSNSTSGNGGETLVTDENGIVWTFSSSNGRTNGTSTSSGQIPSLLYTLPSEPVADTPPEVSVNILEKLVDSLLPVFQKNDQLFAGLVHDTEISSDQVAACFDSPYFHSYLPLLLNQLLGIAHDPLLAQALLPYLISSTAHLTDINQLFFDVSADSLEPPSLCQYFVESQHPYQHATRQLRQLNFPENVQFMTVEFDPRCSTCQPEDCLAIYTDDEYAQQAIHSFYGAASEGNWPRSPLIIPGRQILLEFQTASDYLKADNSQKFGFACRVVGHAPSAKPPAFSFELVKSFAYTAASFIGASLKASFAVPVPKEITPILRRGLHPADSADRDPAQEFLADFTSPVLGDNSGARLARWLEDEVPQDLGAAPDSNVVAINRASRSLYAAVLWHLQIVDDARTVAAYLRFHQTKVNMPPVLALLHKLWLIVHETVETAVRKVDTIAAVIGLDTLFDVEATAGASDAEKPSPDADGTASASPAAPGSPSSTPLAPSPAASSSSTPAAASASSSSSVPAAAADSTAGPTGEASDLASLGKVAAQIIQNASLLLRLNPFQNAPTHVAAASQATQQSKLHDRSVLRASISIVPTPTQPSAADAEVSAHQKARAFLRSSLASIPSSSSSNTHESEAFSTSTEDAEAPIPSLKRRGSAERLFLVESPTKPEPAPKEEKFKLLNNPSRQLYHASESLIMKQIIEFSTSNANPTGVAKELDAVRTAAVSRRVGFEQFAQLLSKLANHPSAHDVLWQLASALHATPVSDAKVPQGWYGGSVGPHYLTGLEYAGEISRNAVRTVVYALYRSVADLLRLHRKVSSHTRLLAMRVWTVKWLPEDHSFLHECQIFRQIRALMSIPKQPLDLATLSGYAIFSPTEIPPVGVTASSSPGMIPSITDASTETFWESSDANNGSPKYLDISFPAETYLQDVSLHIDNVRDREQAVVKVGLFAGQNADALPDKPLYEINVRQNSTKCWNTIAAKTKAKFFRLLLTSKGANARVRLIQINGASKPETLEDAIRPKKNDDPTPSDVVLAPVDTKLSESALLLFRLLTSQVFGGLTNPEQTEKPGVSLQEHLVGLLFIDEKRGLSEVQREVFQNLFVEIQRESIRLRYGSEALPPLRASIGDIGDDLLRVSASPFREKPDDDDKGKGKAKPSKPLAPAENSLTAPDEYCFELISIALALSVSEKGQKFISNPSSIATLLTLLHSSTPRVQRQIVAICKRVLPHLTPEELTVAFSQHHPLIQERGVVFFLFLCIAKALSVQLRGRISGPQVTFDTSLDIVGEQLVGGSWLPGTIPPELAPTLISLINDLEKHPVWSQAINQFMVDCMFSLKDIQTRDVSNCSQIPSMWIALATLMVVGKSADRASEMTAKAMEKFTETGSFVPALLSADNEPKYCENHDDGQTHATIFCSSCKSHLCVNCDRVLHLNRKNQDHLRNSMGVSEQSFSVDVHEGCSRAKMNSLLILVYSDRCKAVVNFRQEPTASSCRFCGMRVPMDRKTPYIPDSPALSLVCEDEICLERAQLSCTRTHPCGHPCGGVRGEKQCLPCLRHCSTVIEGPPLTQDHELDCVICFTEPLGAAPTIRLKCGHCFHYECAKRILTSRWNGARISFNFMQCPLCKTQISHPALEPELVPLLELYEDVKRKALQRVEYMGLHTSEDVTTEGGRFFGDLAGYALDRLCYYPCYKCKKPYFGGLRDCVRQAGNSDDFDPTELVCGACSASAGGGEICAKHGRDYLEFKCRFCCSIALWFCFGTTHFCDPCHNDHSRLCSTKKEDFPQCPVGPRAEKLDGDECPLKMVHPPTGEEFAMGCGICRNASTF